MNISVVTPAGAHQGTEHHLAALAFASALSRLASPITLIQRRADPTTPTTTLRSNLTTRRLTTRSGSPQSYIPAAARELQALHNAGRCDAAVVVTDTHTDAALIHALLNTERTSLPIFTWSASTPLARLRAAPIRTRAQPAFPVDTANWNPPTADTPLIIAADADTPHAQRTILDAFNASPPTQHGWSLAIPGSAGHWSIIPPRATTTPPPNLRRAAVSLKAHAPIAAAHALAHAIPIACPANSPLANYEQPIPGHATFTTQSTEDIAAALHAVTAAEQPASLAARDVAAQHNPAEFASHARAVLEGALDTPAPRPSLAPWRANNTPHNQHHAARTSPSNPTAAHAEECV